MLEAELPASKQRAQQYDPARSATAIQTQCSNAGFHSSALTDCRAVCAGKGANSGVGFAIPIDGAKGLVEQILQYGKVVRPILGITIAPPQVSGCASTQMPRFDTATCPPSLGNELITRASQKSNTQVHMYDNSEQVIKHTQRRAF